jgi:flagellar hook-length control protein FliK
LTLVADIALTPPVTAGSGSVRGVNKAGVSWEDFKKAANDSDSSQFSDCMKAGSDVADDAEQVSAKAEVATPEKTADDKSSDDDDSAAAGASEPLGLGLVASLLQTILAMPPKTDRSVPADTAATAAAAATDSSVSSIGAGISASMPSLDATLAALKNDLAGKAEASMAQHAAPADASAVTATHDTVPDALLAMLNAPAAAVTGTDRAAAVATPAPSQPMPHGELAEPLAERIVWMSDTARANGGNSLQEARISLHPAELGSVNIRVQLADDGSTKVSFDVQTPQARQAIEASLPQLRELLAPNLVNAATASFQLSGGLSQQQQQQPSSQSQTAWSAGNQHESETTSEIRSVTPIAARRRIGLLDQFA